MQLRIVYPRRPWGGSEKGLYVAYALASYDLPNALPMLAVCALSLSGGVAARLHVLAELPVPGSVCFFAQYAPDLDFLEATSVSSSGSAFGRATGCCRSS